MEQLQQNPARKYLCLPRRCKGRSDLHIVVVIFQYILTVKHLPEQQITSLVI
jgi:hypothetical protein